MEGTSKSLTGSFHQHLQHASQRPLYSSSLLFLALTITMLHRALASKAAAGRVLLAAPVLTPAISPAISAAHLRLQGARGQAGRGGTESEEAARAAAQDLSEAARDSVGAATLEVPFKADNGPGSCCNGQHLLCCISCITGEACG